MNLDIHQDKVDEEAIVNRIYLVRGKQVMLSNDLALLYQVETKVLNQQVKRNINKFPERYMFQLTQREHDALRSQNVTLKRGQHLKYLPYAFTEHGILMLSSILKSKKADKINILIIDTFVKIRDIMFVHKDMVLQLEKVKNRLSEHDNQILVILEYIKRLEKARLEDKDFKDRNRIGFRK